MWLGWLISMFNNLSWRLRVDDPILGSGEPDSQRVTSVVTASKKRSRQSIRSAACDPSWASGRPCCDDTSAVLRRGGSAEAEIHSQPCVNHRTARISRKQILNVCVCLVGVCVCVYILIAEMQPHPITSGHTLFRHFYNDHIISFFPMWMAITLKLFVVLLKQQNGEAADYRPYGSIWCVNP